MYTTGQFYYNTMPKPFYAYYVHAPKGGNVVVYTLDYTSSGLYPAWTCMGSDAMTEVVMTWCGMCNSTSDQTKGTYIIKAFDSLTAPLRALHFT